MAWGPGDAAAAIIGQNFGKHKLQGKMIEGAKSVEGSVGMAITSFICVFPILLTMSYLPWYVSLIFSAVIAPIAAIFDVLPIVRYPGKCYDYSININKRNYYI